MELVDGPSLARVLAGGPLSPGPHHGRGRPGGRGPAGGPRGRVWSTATSSPGTCWSARTARSRSPTSGSPTRPGRRRSPGPGRWSARRPTWRPERAIGGPATPASRPVLAGRGGLRVPDRAGPVRRGTPRGRPGPPAADHAAAAAVGAGRGRGPGRRPDGQGSLGPATVGRQMSATGRSGCERSFPLRPPPRRPRLRLLPRRSSLRPSSRRPPLRPHRPPLRPPRRGRAHRRAPTDAQRAGWPAAWAGKRRRCPSALASAPVAGPGHPPAPRWWSRPWR